MNVREKFLQLTSYTYPHGIEDYLAKYLPDGTIKDQWGNYYLIVGDEHPTSMFACHLDTVGEYRYVNHRQNGDVIKTDGKTILGADDKAGMVVMLYMIENKIPGLYYFFIGEEAGCIGSGHVSSNWGLLDFNDNINKVVSFDRRGTKSVITYQLFSRCCSDEFATDLCNKLNLAGGLALEMDDGGIYTDSAKFMSIIPECTNISVGYGKEHTVDEYQNIRFLENLCKSVCLIDWDSLPILRDPMVDDFLYDDDFCLDYYSYFSIDGTVKKMFISKAQINTEVSIINSWLSENGYYNFDGVLWNGNVLYIEDSAGNMELVGNRVQISEYIPELERVSMDELCDNVWFS